MIHIRCFYRDYRDYRVVSSRQSDDHLPRVLSRSDGGAVGAAQRAARLVSCQNHRPKSATGGTGSELGALRVPLEIQRGDGLLLQLGER